ncbi:hypothetical protein ARHIZOSPH14_10870 [Agromyces rhizosphaerae]|uniref:AAA domain-containing protein n=1 Tax=Agromyces rhizosphaerae TaxID=88374 RepID=A0A9W6CUY3_9MICO|nr:AAA family ATPase [Agromyces rhizosphaerae]GLI26845.1 hypothetical protein ARHIZOSPH14_10870 [Agromyces rhizosphaerae]
MTRYLLISRSAEYETRLRRLLRAKLEALPGEYLAFGPDETLAQLRGTPRVALLGPLLNFTESKAIAAALQERHPGIGLIVVREQRSDLEDWVDGMAIHAVLSPEATDQTTVDLINRLEEWLVTHGKLPPVDDEPDEAPEEETPGPEATGLGAFGLDALDDDDALLDEPEEPEAEEDSPEDDEDAEDAEDRWILPVPLDDDIRSEVIAVVAPKGGQGKTTTAINLATGLAEVAPNSVVLVDADVQFGDIAHALNLDPHYSLADVASAGDDEMALKALFTHHEDDFFVVPAPPSPELADDIDAAALGAMLRNLATMFRYVIVDTTPGLGEHALAALENATDGVFVTNMTVPSLRALRKEFELLLDLDILPSNRHVVMNFMDKSGGLLQKDAEEIMGAKVDVLVPRSGAVVFASNQGVPVIHHDVRDPAAKALRELVQRIEPSAAPSRRRIHRKARTQ